jgi:hypothetical protein
MIFVIFGIFLAYTKSAKIHSTDTPYSYSYIIYILLLLLLLSYCHTPPFSPTDIGMGGVEIYLGVRGIYAKNAKNTFRPYFIGK